MKWRRVFSTCLGVLSGRIRQLADRDEVQPEAETLRITYHKLFDLWQDNSYPTLKKTGFPPAGGLGNDMPFLFGITFL